jgi:hypothetical protein
VEHASRWRFNMAARFHGLEPPAHSSAVPAGEERRLHASVPRGGPGRIRHIPSTQREKPRSYCHVALADHLGRARIPYCVTVLFGLFPAALRRRLKKTVFNLLFERRYLNNARFIHAVSPHEIEVIRRHGVRRPVVVLPNGLLSDASMRAPRPDALYAEAAWLRD